MIVVRFKGALGNQMFEYAAAKRLAIHRKTDLQIDLTGLQNTPEGDTPRHYELGCFKLTAKEANLDGYELINVNQSNQAKLRHYIKKIDKKKLWVYSTGSNKFDAKVLNLPGNTLLDGWFTSEKYFANIKPILLSDFSYKKLPNKQNSNTLKAIANTNAVSIHIRRGDYLSNKNAARWHGVLGLDYYEQAINYIANHVSKPEFFVFSNDPDWCKQNLKADYPLHYVDNNDDVNSGAEDMRLMRACQHNIVANSTFSWWGAWLNENPSKIVIAPKRWFKEATVSSADIIPESWVKL